MKKVFGAISALISIAVILTTAISCSTGVPVIPVESVSLKTTESVFIGANATLTPTILPENATDKTLTWTSSDTSVATVTSNGVVTGIKEGTATITATSANGSSGICTITVSRIKVSGITIDITSAQTLYVNDTLQINTTIIPSNATNKALTYSSTDTSIATVSNSGLVTAIKTGECTIKVKADDFDNNGNGFGNREFSLTVKDKPYPIIDYKKGGANYDGNNNVVAYPGFEGSLTAKMSDDSSSTFTWSSSDSSVVEVDNAGKITYKGSKPDGSSAEATITCTAANGETAQIKCRSSVYNYFKFKSSSWERFTQTYTVQTNESEELIFYFNSVSGGCQIIPGSDKVQIKSSDESIVTVEVLDSEWYTAKYTTTNKIGQALITVTIGSYSNSFTIKTTDISGVELNTNSIALTKNQTYLLLATVNPDTASNKNVIWTSSDESVATVSNAGLVTAKASGSVEITAKAEADETKYAKCMILIRDKAFPVIDYGSISGVNRDPSNNEIAAYPGISLKIPVVMNDGSDSTFTYSSSNTELFEVTNDGTLTFKGDPNCSNTSDFNKSGKITITSSTTGESVILKVRTSWYSRFYKSGWSYYGSTLNITVGDNIEIKPYFYGCSSVGGVYIIPYSGYTVLSSDPEIASVSKSSNGYTNITGKKSGQVTITYTLGNMTRFLYVNVSE